MSNELERKLSSLKLSGMVDTLSIRNQEATLPLQPNNSKQETVSVLDIVSSAPPSWTKGKNFEKTFPLVF